MLLITAASLPLQARNLSVQVDEPRQSLAGHVRYLMTDVDTELAEVLRRPASEWQQAPDDINLGYHQQTHWFLISVTNAVAEHLDHYLELGYPMLDSVAFYQVRQDEIIHAVETGDARPFGSRAIEHRNFIFPVSMPAGSTTSIYLRVQTEGALQVPLMLWQEDAFHAASERALTLQSMFYGILLVMAAFNLFLYFSFRERAYLYYVLIVTSTLGLMTGLSGFAFQYVYPELPGVHHALILTIVPFSQFAMCLFAREFLELEDLHPGWSRIFLAMMAAALLCMAGALILDYGLSTRLSVLLAIPVALINLWAGIHLWLQGDHNAKLFSVAWLALLTGSLLTVLNKLGVLGSSVLTEHGIPIGASTQAVLFSFALADRFNRQRDAYLQEKQNSLDAMEQQREAERALHHASTHHELTGLPNRTIFERVTEAALRQNPELETGIFLLHLKNFDDVNKTLGHKQADTLLQDFAQRLNGLLSRQGGALPLDAYDHRFFCVSHVEGVSFAFTVQGSDQQAILARIDALVDQFSKPLEFKGLALELGLVFGCSFASETEREPQVLLRQAFIAFDQTVFGDGNLPVYAPEMNPYSPRRLTLMTELREALRTEGLTLHFQPQIHLMTSRVAGFEALIRWQHPEHGFVPPDEFIPMAEQTGLIKPVTRWVLNEALLFCTRLDEAGCDATVSINISAVNLREPGFCEDVCALLKKNRVAAQRLVLEVTETAAMLDPILSLQALRALRAADVRVSIDDFGTGHSSLSYIRKLPVNEIKIDRSFVMEMDRNKGDATIVRTTVNMCHDLGYEVVAEGVENENIQTLLKTLGCDLIQGYHIARPMSSDAALAWLAVTSWSKTRTPVTG
ncbi:EAL domain-containing protein [Marinobacter sp.]